jgi:hypothetical protein
MRAAALLVLLLCVAGCIYVPRTTEVYDSACHVGARQMTLELTQVGGFTSCQGKGCAELLVAAGAVAAASAVVSGSIVVTGNIVYWFEKEGRCAANKFGATT